MAWDAWNLISTQVVLCGGVGSRAAALDTDAATLRRLMETNFLATAAASTRAFSASRFLTTAVMASTSCVVCLASIVSAARGPPATATCVEINQCVGCTRTRRKILISTQTATWSACSGL